LHAMCDAQRALEALRRMQVADELFLNASARVRERPDAMPAGLCRRAALHVSSEAVSQVRLLLRWHRCCQRACW